MDCSEDSSTLAKKIPCTSGCYQGHELKKHAFYYLSYIRRRNSCCCEEFYTLPPLQTSESHFLGDKKKLEAPCSSSSSSIEQLATLEY
jgi:hypothetical protein